MKIKTVLPMLLLALGLLAGPAAVLAGGMKADAAMAADAIAKAEAARKQAASVNGEWRDTGKFIKQAQGAAKAGEYDKAVKLAKKAEQEGRLGYEQQVSQRELKIPSYLKY
jgi:hypothetical protein